MAYRTCRACFRELEETDDFCRRCFRRETPLARVVVLLGVAAVPTFFAGVLGLNARLCTIGTGIAVVAVVLHIVLALR